jgi:hypothetical protein
MTHGEQAFCRFALGQEVRIASFQIVNSVQILTTQEGGTITYDPHLDEFTMRFVKAYLRKPITLYKGFVIIDSWFKGMSTLGV